MYRFLAIMCSRDVITFQASPMKTRWMAPGVGFEPTRPIGATSSPGLSPLLRFAPYLAGRPRPRILMLKASI